MRMLITSSAISGRCAPSGSFRHIIGVLLYGSGNVSGSEGSEPRAIQNWSMLLDDDFDVAEVTEFAAPVTQLAAAALVSPWEGAAASVEPGLVELVPAGVVVVAAPPEDGGSAP